MEMARDLCGKCHGGLPAGVVEGVAYAQVGFLQGGQPLFELGAALLQLFGTGNGPSEALPDLYQFGDAFAAVLAQELVKQRETVFHRFEALS